MRSSNNLHGEHPSNSDNTSTHLYTTTNNDRLERYGRWLMAIPRDDIRALQETPEYATFVNAFERLGHAHRKAILRNRELMEEEDAIMENDDDSDSHTGTNDSMVLQGNVSSFPPTTPNTVSTSEQNKSTSSSTYHRLRNRNYSFLQNIAVDDVVLRVLEFLNCSSLINTSQTCHRFHQLAHKSAEQCTHEVTHSRLLENAMKLLRAKEHIEGVSPEDGPFVRIPMLGLGRRVQVSRAGDTEYNGIYFCTGSNGNGFIFTKPRFQEWRKRRDTATNNGVMYGEMINAGREDLTPWRRDAGEVTNNDGLLNTEGEETHPSRLLRCVIAKRFSNEVRSLKCHIFVEFPFSF